MRGFFAGIKVGTDTIKNFNEKYKKND